MSEMFIKYISLNIFLDIIFNYNLKYILKLFIYFFEEYLQNLIK